ncbi:MAG: thioredoxin-like domain-containing protein [Bacteroidota bacterium]
MNKKIFFSTVLILLLYTTNSIAQGYNIKVKMSQLKNQELILGHHFATMLIPDDTLVLNNKGEGYFKGKEKLREGMYFIFLPSKKTFDIIVGKDQQFTIMNDTVDLQKNLKVDGSEENQIFVEYQTYFAEQRAIAQKLSEERKTVKGDAQKEIDKKLKQINVSFQTKIDGIITKNPDYFFSKFIKATLEVKIPKTVKGQEARYYYYRGQYFNYFDFKDARLLRSPIYENKLDYYLDKIIPKAPDSIITQVDMLIEGSKDDRELFRYMLVHLFNKFAKSEIMGYENVYVHIAEKYYIPDAEWGDKEFIEELKRKIERKKPGLIGNIAPEIKMNLLPNDPAAVEALRDQLEELNKKGSVYLKNKVLLEQQVKEFKINYPKYNDSTALSQVKINNLATILDEELLPGFEGFSSLHQIDTKYTIMWFWEPDCSHCKTMTPKLVKAYNEKNLKDKSVTVFSVYLHRNINEWDKYTDHIKKWFDFVLENEMFPFINVWEPFGYTRFRDKFDISSSPVLYLLDKDKKIIAKRINPDQAINIIEEIEKSKKE